MGRFGRLLGSGVLALASMLGASACQSEEPGSARAASTLDEPSAPPATGKGAPNSGAPSAPTRTASGDAPVTSPGPSATTSKLDPAADAGVGGAVGASAGSEQMSLDADGATAEQGAADAGPPEPPPMWNEQSVNVRVEAYNFFTNLLYQQDVAWLTSEQIDALRTLAFERTHRDPNQCDEDGGPTTFTVTDEDGSVRVGVYTSPAVDGWALQGEGVIAFLNTLSCREGGAYTLPLPDSPETAPRAVPDDGCYHAFTNPGWFVVDVATPGEIRFALDGDCGPGASVSLYQPGAGAAPTSTDAGTELLGESTSSDTTCPELSVEISEAGAFPVHVRPWIERPSGATQAYFRASSL